MAVRSAFDVAGAGQSPPDTLEQLRQLGQLRDAGKLTTQEFDDKKAELLRRL